MSPIRMFAVAATLFASTASAAPTLSLAGDTSALARIDRAHAEGRIDDATHALLGFRLARDARSLPDEFRPLAGEAPVRCGTLLARRAFLLAKAGAYDAAQAAEFAALGGRPNYPNKVPVTVNAVQVAMLHYPNTVTAGTANAILADLQTSWDVQINTMGWRVPPPDVGAGGTDPDTTLDLYLDPAEFGAVTIPIQEDTCADAWACTASFIILEPGVPNVETYVAHELNHSIQFAYDYSDGDFIYEATATWMEDKVFDSVNDYEFFIADFQNVPTRTLSYATYSNTYMYGGAVFFHYIADLYDAGGTTAVRDVWDGLKANNKDWYDGVDTALSSEGFTDISDVYREFAGVRMLTGIRNDGTLEEGGNMTSLSLENAYDVDSLEGGSPGTPPMGMGASYLVVASAAAGAGKGVTLSVNGDGAGPWAITTVAMPASGAATITVFLDDDGDGKVEATVPYAASFNEIGFAITNTANASDGADNSFGPGGHTVDTATHDFSWSFGGGSEPTSCGCTIPAGRRSPNTVSVIAAFLVAAFTIVVRRR